MKLDKKRLALIAISIVSVILLIFISIFILTLLTFKHLSNGKINQASVTAETAISLINPFSILKIEKNSSIQLTKNSLELVVLLPKTINSISELSQLNNNQNHILDLNQLLFLFKNINSKTSSIIKLSEYSFIGEKILKPYRLVRFRAVAEIFIDIENILNKLVTEPQKWIIVFQNSDELRATGGFMGSYSIIDINEGKIISINTEDIYDADGQFTGFVQAPHGVLEYLSANKGLRLPDANWDPNFPSSAKQILQFFALGNKQNVKGIIVVNIDFAKELLRIIGEVELIDYNTIVNQNNINDVLRSRRSEFFPGSTQKKHLLSQLLTQVQIKITKLDNEKKIDLISEVILQTELNNIQFYSSDPTIDEIFSDKQMRKEVSPLKNTDYLYLVESNVGINKANRNIDRSVNIINQDEKRIISVNFENSNIKPGTSKLSNLVETDDQDSVDHLGYINYQRVYIPADWEIDSVIYNDKDIEELNIQEYQTKTVDLKEIGFLITLPEQSKAELEITFTDSSPTDDSIFIQKQPGIQKTIYTVSTGDSSSDYLIETDQLIKYP